MTTNGVGTPAVSEQADGMAGPKGQPPPEIVSLIEPIEIVDANGYWDGGTLYGLLRDQRGVRVIISVTPRDAEWTDAVPNALYIGATRAQESAARLPLSQAEGELIRARLRSALESRLSKIAAGRKIDDLSQSELAASDDEAGYFAHGILRRLNTLDKFPIADLHELRERIATLEAVDFEALAEEFRNLSDKDRTHVWEKLGPVLYSELRYARHDDVRKFLVQSLGEPDPLAMKKGGTFSNETLTNEPLGEEDLAYILYHENNFYRILNIDISSDGGVAWQTMSMAIPNKEAANDNAAVDD